MDKKETTKATGMKVEVTIERPNGKIEVITHPKVTYMTPQLFETMKKAMTAANKGKCLEYRNVSREIDKARKARNEITRMFHRSSELMDRNPAAGITLEREAREKLSSWRKSYPTEAAEEDAEAETERKRREEIRRNVNVWN
jgi:hypothetical protein